MSDLLGIVPPLQAISLIGGTKKKKKSNLITSATDIIVGSSLISTESNYI